MNIEDKSKWIKEKALELGFLAVHFAKAEAMHQESERLKQWLGLGYHGEMAYMENHFEKRTDPTKLMEGARSVICLAYNYYNPNKQDDPEAPKISMYAYGKDYHKVLKKKLKAFAKSIASKFGEFRYRSFVDSAPVLERDWARRSGLGWVGKNTMVINPKIGSYFFLAELIVDFDLAYDNPIDDYCGTCRRCIDACPTKAIKGDGYVMDGSKCISYLTIELKSEEIPDEFKGKMDNWMFGCDICQDVCPWNRFSIPHNHDEFFPTEELMNMSSKEWSLLDEQKFNSLFQSSAVKRTKFTGLKRNIDFLK